MKRSVINRLIKRWRRLLIGIIFALFIALTIIMSVNALRFNEIMFNPSGADVGMEWIEMRSDTPECIDLSLYKLAESGTNHNLLGYGNISLETCEYYVICDNCSAFMDEYPFLYENIINVSIYKSSFSLSNTGELISLKLNGSVIDELDYSNLTSSAIEGYSIELYNDSWYDSLNLSGTPGYINSIESYHIVRGANISINDTNSTINETTNETMNNTINITINETINITINTSINITTNVTINETTNVTINETINGTLNITGCYISLNITLKNYSLIFMNKEPIKFYNKLRIIPVNSSIESLNYSIEYWVEDLFGNILKNKMITENQNEKSYTPNIGEGDRILIIKNMIANVSCNISMNSTINYSSIILIKNPEYAGCENPGSGGISGGGSGGSSGVNDANHVISEICDDLKPKQLNASLPNESSISINDAFIDHDSFIADIEIYKGDTRKYTIEAAVIDGDNKTVSEKYKFRMTDKFSTIKNVIELKSIRNLTNGTTGYTACNYKIKVIGLGLSEEHMISCEHNYSANQEYSLEQDNTYYSIEDPDYSNISSQPTSQPTGAGRISGNAVYESPNQRSRMYSLIGIIILFLAGTSIFLYKKIKKPGTN